MNAISLNNLWSYIQGLSLTASNQRWLGERLIEASSKHAVLSDDALKQKQLDAMFGVWSDSSDADRIEQAIRDARVCDYERELVPLED